MTKKHRVLIFIVPLLLGFGIYGLVSGLPGPGGDDAVAVAQQAQAEWSRLRSIDIIAQRAWNGVAKPPDAPGTPPNIPRLAGGGAALAAALGLTLALRRRH